MLDVVKIKEAVESGLVAVCAWCEHYWEATSKKPEGHSGCVKNECGGPLTYKAFPLYKGPWSPKEKYCFLCGKDADSLADIGGKGAIGICKEHVPTLKELLNKRKPVNIKEKKILRL